MKAAIVLAGCGVRDGAEIHEAVMTMYAIDKNGGTYQHICTERRTASRDKPHHR